MWHAARRQERMIRGMMVDYQKRAGRRKEYYEQIKQDPNQFLRVNGHNMKIHIDPALAAAAEAPQIMQKWQGDDETVIDRYDARSHIDTLPPVPPHKEMLDIEESRCNYERYRILVQNDCVGVTEQQCLNQIEHDEQYGSSDVVSKEEEKKKKLADKKAAIGYTYDSADVAGTDAGGKMATDASTKIDKFMNPTEEEDDEEEFEEIDLDNILDIELLTEEQETLLNQLSLAYSMLGNDYSEFLQCDRDEMEALRRVREIEEERAAFSGRKSRRERKAFKDQRMKNRSYGSPSYLAKGSPKKERELKRRGSSSSRSRSPTVVPEGKVEFITSFGGSVQVVVDSEEEKPSNGGLHINSEIIGPQLPTSQDKDKRSRSGSRKHKRSTRRSGSRGRRSRSRSRRRMSRGRRSRSRSRRRIYRGNRSRSRSRRRSRSRDRRYRSTRRSRSSDRRRRNRSRSRSSSRNRRRSSERYRSKDAKPRAASSSSSSSSCSPHNDKPNETDSNSSTGTPQGLPEKPPLKKYRRDSLSSSSEFGDSDDSDVAGATTGAKGFAGGVYGNRTNIHCSKTEQLKTYNYKEADKASKESSSAHSKPSSMTPQEKLKRKMQLTLRKQYKADKKARLEKENKEEQLKQEREDELRLLSIQLRQRERERRHKEKEELDRLEAEFKRSKSKSRSRKRKSESGSRSRRRKSKSVSRSRKSKSASRSRKRHETSSSTRRRDRTSSRTSRWDGSRSRESRKSESLARRRRRSRSPTAQKLKLVDY